MVTGVTTLTIESFGRYFIFEIFNTLSLLTFHRIVFKRFTTNYSGMYK